MLSFNTHLAFLQQLPVNQIGQLLLVVLLSFAIITLIASTYRFHQMLQLGEDELVTAQDRNNFFFVQVTRYLSKINRVSNGFGVLIVQVETDEENQERAQNDLFNFLSQSVRAEDDKICFVGEDCVAAIIDTENENTAPVAERITREIKDWVEQTKTTQRFRIGASSFPTNGLTSGQIIDSATQALETTPYGDLCQLSIAPPLEGDETENEEEAIGELSKEDKSSSLDPLTGVLRPEVIGSYMRKYLMEIRRKKEPAAILCVGINRIDNIIKLHGELAADEVIAGVSKMIQRLTRDCDLIGRYHRDDFLILAPGALKDGEQIALRLRNAVQKETFIYNGKRMKTSVSIGITGHPEHGRSLRELFKGAYAALNIIRNWDTSSCLIYDPAKHNSKVSHEKSA